MTAPGVTTAPVDDGEVFDATDLKNQADKNYLPDKATLWEYPKESDGWFHAHNAIRADMQLFEECLMAIQSRGASTNDSESSPEQDGADNNKQKQTSKKTLQEWDIKCLQTIFNAHFAFVHEHHTSEDKILTPAMEKRIRYPPKLTDDHEGIVKQLDNIKKLVDELKPGGDYKTSVTPLLKEFTTYNTDMKAHLKEEEDIGLPLLRAYFDPKEYAKITEEIMKNAPKLELGSFIYHMGENRFRSKFMKQEGIPGFVWYLEFGGMLKLYRKEIIQSVDAIKTGVEPGLRPKAGLFACMG